MSRAYDVVLLGASGFTGALTAEYLARNAPADLKWAVAGRNQKKLEVFGKDVLYADVTDPKSLQALAESTKVVATTVGPYIHVRRTSGGGLCGGRDGLSRPDR